MHIIARRVVITGAAGTLGSAVARAFSAAGAHQVLIDRTSGKDVQLGDVTAPCAFIGDVDLTDPVQTDSAITEALAKLGGLDALINVAGGFRWETLSNGSVETWDSLYTMNLKTAVCACKASLAHLVGHQSYIVNIGAAAAAATAGTGMGAYTASKSGVIKLTEALAEELKDRGVNVNAVLPSIIDTPANRAAMPDSDFTRWVTPEAVADAVMFLASDQARAITGASIPVRGRV